MSIGTRGVNILALDNTSLRNLIIKHSPSLLAKAVPLVNRKDSERLHNGDVHGDARVIGATEKGQR
jgi:hypothetical protein